MSAPTTPPSHGAVEDRRGIATSCEAPPSIADVETALAQARDLRVWWSRVEAGTERIERFALYPAVPGSEPVWGFFGEAPVQGRNVPVMGDVVDDFFDQPRVPPAQQRQAARWMLEQVEEFALHYWLRAEASAQPEPYPELGHAQAAPYLSWLSLCFPQDQEFSGARNLQHLFKLRASGQIGAFPLRNRTAVIDLRELDRTYEWITLDTTDFDFNITIGGASDEAPSLVIPLTTTVHCVMSADLIVNQRAPAAGTLAAFGPGCGLISAARRGVLSIAPEMIRPGLRLQSLRVLETGEVRFRGVMIMPRPERIASFSVLAPDVWLGALDFMTLGATRGVTQPLKRALDRLPVPDIRFDPVLSSVQLLNLLTCNRAATELCISQEQIEKEILAKDSLGMRREALGSRQTWLQVPDWLDSAAIPEWVVRGEIA